MYVIYLKIIHLNPRQQQQTNTMDDPSQNCIPKEQRNQTSEELGYKSKENITVHNPTKESKISSGYTKRNSPPPRRLNRWINHHKSRANATADETSPTADCHTRLSSPTAPFAAPAAAAVVFEVPVADNAACEREGVPVAVTMRELPDELVPMLTDAEDEAAAEEETETVAFAGAVAFPLSPPLPMTGGGVARFALTREPVPQGMGSLVPGWVGLAGGTFCPLVEAMVKRVVQVFWVVWWLVN